MGVRGRVLISSVAENTKYNVVEEDLILYGLCRTDICIEEAG